MNGTYAVCLPLALAAWLLTGCTAVSLSSMKSGMNDLARQKQDLIAKGPPASRGSPGAAGAVVSLAQIDSDLMAVSEEAEALAEATGTSQRAAIGAWRVAVHAAWLALPVNAKSLDAEAVTRALALAEKGKNACDAVDTEISFTNPRDCALIRFAPVQIAFQVSWERYKRLAELRAPQGQAFYRDSARLFREYEIAVWDKAWSEGELAKAYKGLDDSVARYIEDEKFIYQCAALVRFPELNRIAAEPDAEGDKEGAVAGYRSLRTALAGQLRISEAELRSEERVRECTTRLSALGFSS